MKKFKKGKFVQLGLIIAFAVFFLVVLCSDPVLKNRIYTDRPLTMLCVIMWAFTIVVLAFYIFDIHEMLKMEVDNHELSREAYLDSLTGIPNRNSVDQLFNSYTNAAVLPQVGCAVIMISDIREINEMYGLDKGNVRIRDFSNILENVGDRYGFIGRNGGNEYLAVFENCTREKMDTFIKELKESIAVYNGNSDNIPISIDYNDVLNSEEKAEVMTDLIGRAYSKWKI